MAGFPREARRLHTRPHRGPNVGAEGGFRALRRSRSDATASSKSGGIASASSRGPRPRITTNPASPGPRAALARLRELAGYGHRHCAVPLLRNRGRFSGRWCPVRLLGLASQEQAYRCCDDLVPIVRFTSAGAVNPTTWEQGRHSGQRRSGVERALCFASGTCTCTGVDGGRPGYSALPAGARRFRASDSGSAQEHASHQP
jgi:hypothetical protein